LFLLLRSAASMVQLMDTFSCSIRTLMFPIHLFIFL
jgi:hypothetical protein